MELTKFNEKIKIKLVLKKRKISINTETVLLRVRLEKKGIEK